MLNSGGKHILCEGLDHGPATCNCLDHRLEIWDASGGRRWAWSRCPVEVRVGGVRAAGLAPLWLV